MESIESDGLLEFNPNVLYEVRKLYGLENLSDLNKALDILEEWVKQQNHFLKKDFSREVLEKCLMICKGSIERSKKRLDRYCTVRTLHPKFFVEYDFDTDYQHLKGVIWHCLLPKPTKDNYRVLFVKNIGQKFTDSLALDYFRSLLLFAEYIIAHDYVTGFIAVIDYRHVNMMELATKLDVFVMQESMSILMEGYGMRLKGIHIISASKAIDIVVSIFKQALSAKIANRIHVHKTVEELYEHLPKEMLPEDYGGKEKSLEKLHDEFQERFKTKKEVEFRREMNKARTDESLRPKDKFNDEYMGMPGSFRTLTVD